MLILTEAQLLACCKMRRADVEMPGAQQLAHVSEANYDGYTCKRSEITQQNGRHARRFVSSMTVHRSEATVRIEKLSSEFNQHGCPVSIILSDDFLFIVRIVH